MTHAYLPSSISSYVCACVYSVKQIKLRTCNKNEKKKPLLAPVTMLSNINRIVPARLFSYQTFLLFFSSKLHLPSKLFKWPFSVFIPFTLQRGLSYLYVSFLFFSNYFVHLLLLRIALDFTFSKSPPYLYFFSLLLNIAYRTHLFLSFLFLS